MSASVRKRQEVARQKNNALGHVYVVLAEDCLALSEAQAETVLPSLTHDNLKEFGVASFGHRVKLLDAIAQPDHNVHFGAPPVGGANIMVRLNGFFENAEAGA